MAQLPSSLLLIFLKYPEPGRVKTRIAADVGAESAAAIYREMVGAVLGALPAGQAVRICYDSFRPEADYREWLDTLSGAEFSVQSHGTLGDRLEAAFAEAFRDGWQRVGVIGGDCISLTPELYTEAWQALETNEVVLGPTFDGGYYFLAGRMEVRSLFRDIEWSTERVFEQTVAAAEMAHCQVYCLKKLSDIDTLADWEAREREVG